MSTRTEPGSDFLRTFESKCRAGSANRRRACEQAAAALDVGSTLCDEFDGELPSTRSLRRYPPLRSRPPFYDHPPSATLQTRSPEEVYDRPSHPQRYCNGDTTRAMPIMVPHLTETELPSKASPRHSVTTIALQTPSQQELPSSNSNSYVSEPSHASHGSLRGGTSSTRKDVAWPRPEVSTVVIHSTAVATDDGRDFVDDVGTDGIGGTPYKSSAVEQVLAHRKRRRRANSAVSSALLLSGSTEDILAPSVPTPPPPFGCRRDEDDPVPAVCDASPSHTFSASSGCWDISPGLRGSPGEGQNTVNVEDLMETTTVFDVLQSRDGERSNQHMSDGQDGAADAERSLGIHESTSSATDRDLRVARTQDLGTCVPGSGGGSGAMEGTRGGLDLVTSSSQTVLSWSGNQQRPCTTRPKQGDGHATGRVADENAVYDCNTCREQEPTFGEVQNPPSPLPPPPVPLSPTTRGRKPTVTWLTPNQTLSAQESAPLHLCNGNGREALVESSPAELTLSGDQRELAVGVAGTKISVGEPFKTELGNEATPVVSPAGQDQASDQDALLSSPLHGQHREAKEMPQVLSLSKTWDPPQRRHRMPEPLVRDDRGDDCRANMDSWHGESEILSSVLTADAPCVPVDLAARDRRRTEGLLREEHTAIDGDADTTGDRKDRNTLKQPGERAKDSSEAAVRRCLQHAFKRWERAAASVAAASRPVHHSEGRRRIDVASSAGGRQSGTFVPAHLESADKGLPMAGDEEPTPQAPLVSPTTRRHSFHGADTGSLMCKANILSTNGFPPCGKDPSLLPAAPEVGWRRPSQAVGASSRHQNATTTTVDGGSFRSARMPPSRMRGGHEEHPRRPSIMLRLDTVSEEVATPAVTSGSLQDSGGRQGNVVPPPLVYSRSLLSAPAGNSAKGWGCPFSPMPAASGNVSSECKTYQTTGGTSRYSERGVNRVRFQVPGRFVASSRCSLTVLEGCLHGDGSVRDRRASNGGLSLHAQSFEACWHSAQTGGVSTEQSSALASTATTSMPSLLSNRHRRQGNNIPAHFAGGVTGWRVAGSARCSSRNPLLHPWTVSNPILGAMEV